MESYHLRRKKKTMRERRVQTRIDEVEDIEKKRHGLEVLIDHLEENPEPVKERTFKQSNVLETLFILRLDIESITGKDGSSSGE